MSGAEIVTLVCGCVTFAAMVVALVFSLIGLRRETQSARIRKERRQR